MLINEVCQLTGLTKKAIEYYQAKGMVSPVVEDNGYRDFRLIDVIRLKEISLLRKLDLDVDQVKEVLESPIKSVALSAIKQRKELSLQLAANRCELLEQLIQGQSPDQINARMNRLLEQSKLKEKLLMAFPGFYGRFISFHFGRFMDIDLITDDQKMAWQTIVDYLDSLDSINIPESLQAYYLTVSDHFNQDEIANMATDLSDISEDFDLAWQKYGDAMIRYQAYKQTAAFMESDAAQLMSVFQHFCQSTGYYDIFIPAMRKISPAYEDYYQKMLIAHAKLLQGLTKSSHD